MLQLAHPPLSFTSSRSSTLFRTFASLSHADNERPLGIHQPLDFVARNSGMIPALFALSVSWPRLE